MNIHRSLASKEPRHVLHGGMKHPGEGFGGSALVGRQDDVVHRPQGAVYWEGFNFKDFKRRPADDVLVEAPDEGRLIDDGPP